tara:strand:+ start:1626 stop:2339 length:714 start_codon:yes stop_codon:yes gene_type:complete
MPEILSILLGITLIWLIIDFFVWCLYVTKQTGEQGACYLKDWVSIGPITGLSKPDKECTYDSTSSDCSKGLGRWAKYKIGKDDKHPNSLCKREIDNLYKENIEGNIVAGYNAQEIIGYIIVPFITVICIILGIISTSASKAEWTFWIMIATIIFTSVRSIAYDSDLNILPEESSPLAYIIDKLNLSGTDELKYSFIARKQDGGECFVEGTLLGAGITPENQPPVYSGFCTAETLPLE